MRASMKTFGGVLVALAGCSASEGQKTGQEQADTGTVTWYQHVAPIVSERCAGCHQDSGIAPFSVETYEGAAPYAAVMAREVAAERMPPWLARDTDECVPRFGWKDDIRLTDAEKATLAAWAEAGAPEGDPSRPAPLRQGPPLTIEDPDLSLVMPVSVEIDGDADQFWCFVLETGLGSTHYYDQVQVIAGNAAVVHHVLVYRDANDNLDEDRIRDKKYECFGGPGVSGAQLVAAWAPGGVPIQTPPDVAFEFPAGTRLVMQVHYHPTGVPEIDEATSVELRQATGTPSYRASTSLMGNFVAPSVVVGGLLPGPNDPEGGIEFKIPAGVSDHVETMIATASSNMIIYGAGTHMHYVGRDMVIHLEHASPQGDEPERECLIHAPEWDFNWQRGYRYDAPLDQVPVARPGDRFIFRCRYDNSMDNPFVREALREQGLDAPRDVYMGEETLDEMCLGAFAVATPIE
jgi:hypothetical protein